MPQRSYSGGTLFQIALEEYGDPMQWWRIAAANGLSDFVLVGNGTLTIPPRDPTQAGSGLPSEIQT